MGFPPRVKTPKFQNGPTAVEGLLGHDNEEAPPVGAMRCLYAQEAQKRRSTGVRENYVEQPSAPCAKECRPSPPAS